MSITAGRPYGLLITVAVIAVGAAVAAVVFFRSSEATGVDLTTAGLVPANAGIYFALNTDLTSSQWIAAFDLATRLGDEDAEQELEDAIEDGDVDYDDEFTPFLGGNAAVYFTGFDLDAQDADGALIILASDAEAALDVILDRIEDFDEEEYEGVTFYVAEDQPLYAARIGDHIVLAINERSLEDVIDVSNGDEPSLTHVDAFVRLRDELSRNFLAFAFLDPDKLTGDLAFDDDELRDALDSAGVGALAFEPVAWAVGASGDGFEFQGAAIGDGGSVSPLAQPRDSRFVGMVPADAAVFFSTFGIAETWEEIVAAAEDEIDDAIAEEGTYGSLDEALEAAGEEIGLDSAEELLDLFAGETAIAVWFPTGEQEEAEFVFLSEVDDEDRAREIIESVVASIDPDFEEDTIAGIDVLVFAGENASPSEQGVAAVTDGYVIIGTPAAVEEVLEGPDDVLSGSSVYQTAVEHSPGRLGTYLFLNMRDILRLDEGGIPPQLDEAEEVLEAVIFNLVEQNGIVRYSGVLTVADE